MLKLLKMAEIGIPKIAESPLELLNSPGIEPGLINIYYNPVAFGLVGVLGAIFGNWATRRPLWSGIQKHILTGSAGVGVGFWFDRRRNRKLAERDAIFRNYIELHPEDFPPYVRKQYKDVFEPWIPIR